MIVTAGRVLRAFAFAVLTVSDCALGIISMYVGDESTDRQAGQRVDESQP